MLRSFALLLILLLIFEPVLNIISQSKIVPTNLVFIDNSNSISQFNKQQDVAKLTKLINDLNTTLDGETQFYTFGANLNKYKPEIDSLKFDETFTELNSVIKEIKNIENISSIVLITDGIINQNINPESEFKNLPFPIFTVGIGDSTEPADLSVDQIVSNDFIYAGRESEIEILLRNNALKNFDASIKVFDNDSLINTRVIELSNTGINRIRIPYLNIKEGKHKITVRASITNEEKNVYNNVSTIIINVLAAKKKIALIAGSPSRDLSFIANSIKQNDEYSLEKIVEIKNDNFYKNFNNLKILNDSDIIFLVGFPNYTSPPEYINEIESIISSSKIPIFFAFSPSIDFVKLRLLESVLPFKINSIAEKFEEVQVASNYASQSILGDSDNKGEAWKSLPPVTLTKTVIEPSFSSEILLHSVATGNKPIVFSNTYEGRKSIIVSASNIWRWKLKDVNNEHILFDNFILNSIKWLGIQTENKYFSVTLNKESYNLGEPIPFIANLYDETFEPVDNEAIILKIFQDGNLREFNFNSIGKGLYQVNIEVNSPGLINFSSEIVNNIRKLPAVKGTINIDPIKIELVESKLNNLFLTSIAVSTGGQYYNLNETQNIITELNKNYLNKIYYKNTDKELRLSSFELILLIIVLLFSIEWIIRKIFRMI